MNAHPALKASMRIVYWLPIPTFLVKNFGTVMTVTGTSMQPTLNPYSSPGKDIVFFDRFSISSGNWQREDIVAFKSPIDSKTLLVKRIIALEGDTVKTRSPYPDEDVLIPPGHAWVEGDEPYRSEDSNIFGPLPLALLDSKLTYILWPHARSGPIRQPSLPVMKRGAHQGPLWRHEMAEYQRVQSRKARVIMAPSTSGHANE